MNPWGAVPDSEPYVLPDDQSEVEQFNRGASDQHRLRLAVLPEPFLGNRFAPVVLLNKNPGFSEMDAAIHHDPAFNSAARANLLHGHREWPLFLLDPALQKSPGQKWWSQRLRLLAKEVGDQRVARSVFVAEIHGYHSIKYRSIRLPSQGYTRELVLEAISRRALFIVMRARGEWHQLVPELKDAPQVFVLRSPQNVTLSPRNCPDGFGPAVEALRAAG